MIPFTSLDFVAIFLCTRSIRVNTQGTSHYNQFLCVDSSRNLSHGKVPETCPFVSADLIQYNILLILPKGFFRTNLQYERKKKEKREKVIEQETIWLGYGFFPFHMLSHKLGHFPQLITVNL